MSDYGEYRSILAQVPGTAVFEQLCDVLKNKYTVDEREFVYLESHLARWSSEIKRPIPETLISDMLKGQPTALSRLGNALVLNDSCCDVEGLRVALSEGLLDHISHLSLAYWELDTSIQDVLVSFSRLPVLRTLDLRYLKLDDTAFDLLPEGLAWPALRVLDVHFTALDVRAFSALVRTGAFRQLEVLDVRYNPLSDEAIGVLATCEDIRALRTLRVYSDGMSHTAYMELMSSQYLSEEIKFLLDVKG